MVYREGNEMSTYNIQDIEGNLLNIIERISPLEWRRYKKRYYKLKVGNQSDEKDFLNESPFIAFRFEKESKEVINKLKLLINNYNGKVKWELCEHNRTPLPGTNWVIRPLKISQVTTLANKAGLDPVEYLAKNEPEFGSIAFDDLNDLTNYIQKNFIN